MKKISIFFALLAFATTVRAQSVGIGTTTPDASALLDVSSTTKGLLPPRMTTAQRDLITTPAAGLVLFNSTTNSIQLYSGSGWISLTASFASLPAIVIGTQQWMSKNLDVAFYRNGDSIPQVRDTEAWSVLTTGVWCYLNNDSTLGNKYGKLYNWYAVNDPRGLAPQGWHIPTDAEWTTLETTLGGASAAGGQMKEVGTLNWLSPNTGGNNNSGFIGLPGGLRRFNGTFTLVGYEGHWWSSTESNTLAAWVRYLSYFNGNINKEFSYKQYGFSVRCLRN